MKVFEVVIERMAKNSTELTRVKSYVTSERDSLSDVAVYFRNKCIDYDYGDLKSVREVITISQNIAVLKTKELTR